MKSTTYFKSPAFWALAVFVLILTVFGYKNHFNNPFHFDDAHTIWANLFPG